ncbi:sugar phosphate isomerase/epimerase [Caldicoprobacter guelmensis]|uniref:TIM barrel protein n=1 Tax=Caldicoprobacter guelmensis TaxID=1170224 RepID=UPI00195A6605|nr:sugar phosphate isomerase/epimerase [Caldicoprobacter guelmensis]
MSKFILSAFADEIDLDLKVQMDVLEQHGIGYIEMRGVYGKSIVQYSLDEVKDIKRKLDERGFKISAVGSPIGKIGILDDFEPHLKLFKHTIEIAKILETNYIRMFSFYIPKGDDPAKYRDEVLRRWEEFIKAAQGTGLTLLHENEKDIYGDTAERCLDLLKTLNCEYVKFTFDPANFVQCDVETYPHAFNLLKDYIAYMHIKDALYSNHSVVPAGYGDGRVKEILAELYNMGYEGFLSIEPHLGNFVGFSQLEQGMVDPNLPEGGPKLFGVAASALKKILSEIEGR